MPIDNEWYHSLGDSWWDPDGTIAALHEVNPVRVQYFCDVLGDLRGLTVLDLGCGGGLMAEEYARRGAAVVGLDRSVPSLRAARRHAAKEALPASYVGGRAEALPFPPRTFDAVLTADTLEHVDDLDSVIAESARVLRPGGTFAYDTVNRTWKAAVLLEWLPQRVFRIAPPHTHEYRRFIKPEELHELFRRHGLVNQDLQGLALRRNPLAAAVSYARRRRLGGFVLGKDTGMSYVGYATRTSAAAV